MAQAVKKYTHDWFYTVLLYVVMRPLTWITVGSLLPTEV